jgi:hypothetical protein
MAAIGALSVGALLMALAPAQAGILDFLFGGLQRALLPPSVNSYADPQAPVTRRGGGTREEGAGNGWGGRALAYCVRLCDGQHFPMHRIATATPVDICKTMCPASKTKVFFGGAIDHAVARDGQRYTDLDNAYLYREHLVADCTCNGKDAFGLAPVDPKNDPTLRPGDIVATKDGLMTYNGKRGSQTAEFTPVDPASIAAELAQASGSAARARLTRRAEPPADDEPGTVVQQPADMRADLRGQPAR